MARAATALAAAAAVGLAAADAPSQFHIAVAPAGMRVAFKMNATAAPQTCVYGAAPGQLNATATTGAGRQYLPDHGYHFDALLAPLAPATQYWYSCAGSPAKAFTTAPVGTDEPFNLVAFGDWGWLGTAERGPALGVGGLQLNWSAVPARQLLESLHRNGSADLVWNIGDMAYADDAFGYWADLLKFDYENVYDSWMSWIENVSSTTPFMVAPGNHESECHSPACFVDLPGLGEKLRNFSAYNARWVHMPWAESGGSSPMWFSFDYGMAHFTVLDTSTDFPDAPEGTTGDSHSPLLPAGGFAPNGTYAQWVEADLARAAANPATRWIIAGGHRPFESLPAAHASYLAGLFAKYNVSLYLAGHVHSYKREDAATWGDGVPHVTAQGARRPVHLLRAGACARHGARGCERQDEHGAPDRDARCAHLDAAARPRRRRAGHAHHRQVSRRRPRYR